MKCKLLIAMEAGPTAPDDICTVEDGRRIIEAGTVIESPAAWRLVHGGFAEPADKECEERLASVNQSQAGKLRQVHERIMREHAEFLEELEAEEDE
jgi:hypothetical protein